MTTITITADMNLREIALAAYRTSPAGVDFTETPDGIIIFTDARKPDQSFAFGFDPGFGGDDDQGVTWAAYVNDEDGLSGGTSDGCDLDHLDELGTALARWIDAGEPETFLATILDADGEQVDADLRDLDRNRLEALRVEAGASGDWALVNAVSWILGS